MSLVAALGPALALVAALALGPALALAVEAP